METIEKWLDTVNLAFRLFSKIMEICTFDFTRSHLACFLLTKKYIFIITRNFYFIKLYKRDLCPRNKNKL